MLTRNYYHKIAGYHISKSGYSGLSFIDPSGASKSAYSSSNEGADDFGLASAGVTTGTPSNTSCIVFGDGDTPPTVDDYNISGAQLTTLNNLSSTGVVERYENGVKVRRIYTIQNTGDEDIVVREIAWFASASYSSNSSSAALYDRTVLENPVTIAPGASAAIEYVVDFTF